MVFAVPANRFKSSHPEQTRKACRAFCGAAWTRSILKAPGEPRTQPGSHASTHRPGAPRPLGPNLPSGMSMKIEQAREGTRIFLGGSIECPQLAYDRLARSGASGLYPFPSAAGHFGGIRRRLNSRLVRRFAGHDHCGAAAARRITLGVGQWGSARQSAPAQCAQH